MNPYENSIGKNIFPVFQVGFMPPAPMRMARCRRLGVYVAVCISAGLFSTLF